MCLKSNRLCTLHKQLLSQRKKHCLLWCHNVLWFRKPNFSILLQQHFFARFSVKALFFVTVSWKFNKIKNFWLFFVLVQRMSVEQRNNMKFLVCLGKTPTEALKLLQEVYGDDTMSKTRLFEWNRRLKEGREEVQDDDRSGKLSTSRTDENVERVRQKVRSDHRLTVRIIDKLGMNSDKVWRIIWKIWG